MKLSLRELILAWLVGLLVLCSFSWWYAAPKIRVWQEMVESREKNLEHIALLERLIDTRSHWEERLDALKTQLAKYDREQDVTADYLKILERVAQENSLNLIRRQAQKEKPRGDLYELAVDCTWESSLHPLIKFLFALGQEGVAMDIDELTISLVSGAKDQLRGNFTLKCAYSRDGAPATPVPPPQPLSVPPDAELEPDL